jgi:predicted acyl esterase
VNAMNGMNPSHRCWRISKFPCWYAPVSRIIRYIHGVVLKPSAGPARDPNGFSPTSAYYGAEATGARIRFFDFTLKGIRNGLDREPPVRLAIYDEGPDPIAVTASEPWPPANLIWASLHLDAGGKCSPEPASVNVGRRSFSTRGAPAGFDWVFDKDVDVIGPMAVRIYVEVSGGDDAVLFAGIRKFRGRRELTFEGSFGFAWDMVTKGWQRVAHRELDHRLSTPEQPVHTHVRAEPLLPGEIVPVDIALLPQATRFLKGDRLRLELRGRGTTHAIHSGGSSQRFIDAVRAQSAQSIAEGITIAGCCSAEVAFIVVVDDVIPGEHRNRHSAIHLLSALWRPLNSRLRTTVCEKGLPESRKQTSPPREARTT